MNPFHLLAWFAAGALLMNAMPHLLSGAMGRKFPSPFAKPPGKGLSSALVNVLWGFGNLVGGYLLLCQVGDFDPRNLLDAAPFALGLFLMSLMLALHFGGLNGGSGPGAA